MGIPHFITLLGPYASSQVLSDEHLVIDGPALAYHLWWKCLSQLDSQPTYKHLENGVQRFLQLLEVNRITLDAIYFDGQLPEEKLETRLSRVKSSTSQMVALHSKNKKGLPLEKFKSYSEEHEVQPFRLSLPAPGLATNLPAPAFLVPSVVSILRTTRVRNVVHLVPGEADTYCASHMSKMETGGIVMSSDSDLLVHDLGKGRVVFFRDIEQGPETDLGPNPNEPTDPSILRAMVYDPRDISERLRLQHPGGIIRLAYEILKHPYEGTSKIVSLARSALENQEEVNSFQKFSEQYVLQDQLSLESYTEPLPLSFDSSHIHARLSELALQISSGTHTARLFLPLLLEDPQRRSAWDSCTHIRELAYSISRIAAGSLTPESVQEYRRVQNVDQKGRAIDLWDMEDVKLLVGAMLTTLQRAQTSRSAYRQDETRWFVLFLVFSTSDDDVAEEASDLPPWHKALVKETSYLFPSRANGRLVSWDVLHFYAHIHATLYSLHMLFGVLDSPTVRPLLQEVPELRKLHKLLDPIPKLEDWPELGNAWGLLNGPGRQRLRDLAEELGVTFRVKQPGRR